MKPITSKELKELLLKVKRELDDEQSEKRYLELLKQQVQQSLPLLKERFLNQLISYPIKEEELNRNCSYLSLKLPNPPYTVMLVELDIVEKSFEEVQLLQFALSNLCHETFGNDEEEVISFSNRHGQTVLIVSVVIENMLLEQAFYRFG